MIRKIFVWGLEHRRIVALVLLVVSAILAGLAAQVRPDYSVEHLFPVWSESRAVYDRYKRDFPHEDTEAYFIVEADDLFSREGLARLQALEDAAEELPHVIEVRGPLSIRDLVGEDGMLAIEPLFSGPDLSPEAIAEGRATATTDPIFAWNLAAPDGDAVTIRVTLDPREGDSDQGRQEFYTAARELARAQAHPGQRIVVSGLPSIRARFAQEITQDTAKLMPLALLIVLVMLFVIYRSIGAVLAGLATVLAALVWSLGVQGLLGFPTTLMISIAPIVVMIISVSDTVHIVNEFFALRREGQTTRDALATAMAHAAGPCLATELVIACGFLTLLAVNIVAVYQFALTAACAMLLTWAANMTVLPLCLSLVKSDGRSGRGGDEPPGFIRLVRRVIGWIERQVVRRPRVVVASAALIVVSGLATATLVDQQSYVFDDLDPQSPFAQELRFAEATHGGLVPVAIYIESLEQQNGAILSPQVIRAVDEAAAMLDSFPELRQATSVTDYLRKAHGLLAAGDEELLGKDGLPQTRRAIAQEVELIDEGSMLRDYLSFDRRSVAAVGYAVDAGSQRFDEMFATMDAWVQRKQRELDADPSAPRVRIAVTGQLELFREINASLTGGLAASFGLAILITFVVFMIALRSIRLGLIGIIPNVTPMVLTIAFMAVAGIDLRPMTVIVFSIILVIADDDTVQYLARLRSHWRQQRELHADDPNVDLHRETALATMRETGEAMFVTSTTVSAGFLLLLTSGFRGLAHMGVLIGVTLFFAIFADLFLAPLLVQRLRPKLGRAPDPRLGRFATRATDRQTDTQLATPQRPDREQRPQR